MGKQQIKISSSRNFRTLEKAQAEGIGAAEDTDAISLTPLPDNQGACLNPQISRVSHYFRHFLPIPHLHVLLQLGFTCNKKRNRVQKLHQGTPC